MRGTLATVEACRRMTQLVANLSVDRLKGPLQMSTFRFAISFGVQSIYVHLCECVCVCPVTCPCWIELYLLDRNYLTTNGALQGDSFPFFEFCAAPVLSAIPICINFYWLGLKSSDLSNEIKSEIKSFLGPTLQLVYVILCHIEVFYRPYLLVIDINEK